MATRQRILVSLLLSLALLAVSAIVLAQAAPPGCIGATQQTFAATGSLQTYTLPAGAAEVFIVAEGASGGENYGYDPVINGGHGARIAAVVPVSGLSSLNVVVGGKGHGDSTFSAGGGGGSFIFTPTNALLVAAGGGGGTSWAGVIGYDAETGQNGSAGHAPSAGTGGTGGQGGSGGTTDGGGGGGGGFLSSGGPKAGQYSGEGGHQISSPGDAAGGDPNEYSVGHGGFGGGGGGASNAGGGGGYSGGGGNGGGGGSYVVASGTPLDSRILTTYGDGSVTICVTRVENIPTLSPWGLGALVLLLLGVGVVAILRRP